MSDRDLHRKASELFLDLRELKPDERQARLDRLTDAGLKREVLDLLQHDDAGATLNPTEPGAPSRPFPSPVIPAKIGPYSILRLIGRGGSGYVLLGEQHQPIHRLVAIKVVPHAATDPDSAARFEFERRALERTDHPNIARILDAGATTDGLPYIVIEYVEGKPLSAYCRDRDLSIRDRIELFLDIADAVQHAHQRGVIHRDLKPANILVSETSGRPTPRVLDFGIAKPTGPLGGEAQVTRGFIVGTPEFMAPEQFGGRTIDTRADIYGLGAVLYDLIAGRPPFEFKGDFPDLLSRRREATPIPASQARSAALAERDKRTPSSASAEPLSRAFSQDLDCILAKALDPDPGQRYQTVSELAEDLRRLLLGQPILAQPPTLRYHAARFIQRNRLLVASAAIIVLALVLGVGGLGVGLFEATRQRREAANQTDAQREINRFLTDDLLAAASPEQEGHEISALELLKRASKRVEERFRDRPLIAAAIHHTLGNTFAQLGSLDDADRHLQRAIALRRAAAGTDAPDTVRSEIAAASLIARRQDPAAEAALRQVIDRARLILGPDDRDLYTALNDLGTAHQTTGKTKEAVAVLQEALAGRIRLLGAADPIVLMTMSNLGQAYDLAGQGEESLKLHLDALRIADSMEDPPRMTVIGLCNNIGATYQDQNRDQEAAPYVRRAAELGLKWLGPDNPDTWTIQGNLGSLEAELGNPQRGAEVYQQVIEARTRLLGPDAHDTLTARFGYWNCLWIGKRFDEAAAGYKALLPDVSRALGDTHWLTIQTRSVLARALHDGGRSEEALPYAQQAADDFLNLRGPDHPRTRNAVALLDSIKARLAQNPPPS